MISQCTGKPSKKNYKFETICTTGLTPHIRIYTCNVHVVKVRSGPPHDGTIITEKNATMVTSSSSSSSSSSSPPSSS